MPETNLDHIVPEELADRPAGFALSEAPVGVTLGAEHLAGNVLELPPGQRAWPYHWESSQEEWLIVLSGTPTVRTPEGEEELVPGDVVCFPVGPAGAHQVRNASTAPCRVLMLSDVAPVNVVRHPDTNTFAVNTPWWSGDFAGATQVKYWEGV